MELRITTLIENMPSDDGDLLYEHGLSLFIEFGDKKILMDTGQSGDYLKNAARLNKSVKDIDYFIVSHGHYDHSGGVIQTIAELNSNTNMYVGEEFFCSKYKVLEDGSYKFNGNGFSKKEIDSSLVKLNEVCDDIKYISENIILFKNFSHENKFEKMNPKFVVDDNGKMVLDDFPDEIVLGLITSKGLVVITGCSHIGIVNILSTIYKRMNMPIYAVLGGTHLVAADENRINETILALRRMHIQYVAVSHCTGELGIEMMKGAFGMNFIRNNTGHIFEI